MWKVTRLSIRQKIGILMFLTMNIWLIVIAIVRVSSVKQGETTDMIWYLFFNFLEPNVAILAACFSAFRSVFVFNGSKSLRERFQPSYTLRQRLCWKDSSNHERLDDLPTIPSATLTNVPSTIWSGHTDHSSIIKGHKPGIRPLVKESKPTSPDLTSKIYVQQGWSLESTKV